MFYWRVPKDLSGAEHKCAFARLAPPVGAPSQQESRLLLAYEPSTRAAKWGFQSLCKGGPGSYGSVTE